MIEWDFWVLTILLTPTLIFLAFIAYRQIPIIPPPPVEPIENVLERLHELKAKERARQHEEWDKAFNGY